MKDLFDKSQPVTITFKESLELNLQQPSWWTPENVTKPVRPRYLSARSDKNARGGHAWWIDIVVDDNDAHLKDHLEKISDPAHTRVHLLDVESGLYKTLLLTKLWAEWEPAPEFANDAN